MKNYLGDGEDVLSKNTQVNKHTKSNCVCTYRNPHRIPVGHWPVEPWGLRVHGGDASQAPHIPGEAQAEGRRQPAPPQARQVGETQPATAAPAPAACRGWDSFVPPQPVQEDPSAMTNTHRTWHLQTAVTFQTMLPVDSVQVLTRCNHQT